MHEFAMATQIVENVLEEAKKYDAKKVDEVHLIIGKMTFLGVDQIRFSYDILIKDTILKDSKLVIEEQDGVIECSSCGFKGAVPIEDDKRKGFLLPIISDNEPTITPATAFTP